MACERRWPVTTIKPPEHVCRAPGCERPRQPWAITCLKCWKKVPQELKDRIHEAKHENGLRSGIQRGLAAYAVINWLAGGQEEMKL